MFFRMVIVFVLALTAAISAVLDEIIDGTTDASLRSDGLPESGYAPLSVPVFPVGGLVKGARRP